MSDCEKCGCFPGGFTEGLREPWCQSCRQKFRDEYRRVRKEWALRNAEILLREMGVPAAYRSCSFLR
jgi:hypothetical protein